MTSHRKDALSDLPGYSEMRFAVVDRSRRLVSVHQHPDAAERVIRRSPRTDLSWIEVEP